MVPSSKPFPPLSGDRQQIRLLKLHSSRSNDDIRFTHESHDLGESCPAYTALSYTRGSAADNQTILLNDHPFSIRHNLYDFLKTYNECAQDPTFKTLVPAKSEDG
jgi:hypothetical protein